MKHVHCDAGVTRSVFSKILAMKTYFAPLKECFWRFRILLCSTVVTALVYSTSCYFWPCCNSIRLTMSSRCNNGVTLCDLFGTCKGFNHEMDIVLLKWQEFLDFSKWINKQSWFMNDEEMIQQGQKCQKVVFPTDVYKTPWRNNSVIATSKRRCEVVLT